MFSIVLKFVTTIQSYSYYHPAGLTVGGTNKLLKNICNTIWFISAYRPGEETVKT